MRLLLHGLRHVSLVVTIRWWTTVAWVKLRLCGCSVGPGLRVTGPIRVSVHPTASVRIGRNFRVNSVSSTNPVGAFRATWFHVAKGANLTVGNDVGISSSTLVCTVAIEIGDEAMLGGDVSVYDTDFHSVRADHRLSRPDTRVGRGAVRVGPRAFVGAHAIILKGVTIGREAVIGAGSVVSRDVPDGQVWAGVPARRIGDVPGGAVG